jgi:hypothetical protein
MPAIGSPLSFFSSPGTPPHPARHDLIADSTVGDAL